MWYHRRKDISLFVFKKNKGSADFSLKSANLLESSLFKVFTFFFAVGLGLSWLIPQPAISQAKPKDVELTLVSFAVTKSAYAKKESFPASWRSGKRENNQNVNFNQSYGGSGSQTRAVIDGLEADVVHLSRGFRYRSHPTSWSN